MVNKQFAIYRPRPRQVVVGRINKAQVSETVNEVLAFTNVSEERLKAGYNFKSLGREKLSSGVSTPHLEFTPKVAKSYKTAEIWVDEGGMPNQLKVVLNNSDSITVLFTDIEKNVAVKADVFKLNLPEGIKIIKN